MVLWVIYEKPNRKLVYFSGLVSQAVARCSLTAPPLRVLLENAKNGSNAVAGHAGCQVCQDRTRGPPVVKWPQVRPRRPARVNARVNWAKQMAYTGLILTYTTREPPLLLSRLPQDRFVDLQQQHGGYVY